MDYKKTGIFILLAAVLFIPAEVSVADIIVLQDGRSVEGEIIKREKRTITVKTEKGIITKIQRSEIERIVSKEDMIKEYRKKRKKIDRDDPDAHMELADWCRENGLKAEQMDELNEILRIDPDNKLAQKKIHLLEGTVPEEWKDDEMFKPKTRPSKKGAGKTSKKPKKSGGGKVIVIGKEGGGGGKAGKGSPAKPEDTKKTLAKALAYLAKAQRGDGSFGKSPGNHTKAVVVTTFAGLAFIADGSTPAKGPYAATVNKALNFVKKVIALPRRTGRAKQGGGNTSMENWRWMMGGLFLAECYACHKDPNIKAKLQEVVNKLEESMESMGGWAHGPGGPNVLNYLELEVMSNYALSTLGMAKELGCKVDSKKLKQACDYIIQCSNGMGGIGYSTRRGQKGFGCPGRTGGAITAFNLCKSKHALYAKMIKYLDRTVGDIPNGHASPAISYIGGALGCLQVSKTTWGKYVQTLFPKIIEHANDDGSIRTIINPREGDKETRYGLCYTTGMFAFILAVDEGRLRFLGGKYGK